MEDLFEVLIYIFFIAASLIGGLYKNYAKKKQEEAKVNRRRELSQQEAYESPTYEDEPPGNPTYTNPLEEFLKEQFDLEFDNEQKDKFPELEEEKVVEAPERLQPEGKAVFENPTQTLLSDNMKEEGFSITNAIEEMETEAMRIENNNPIYDGPFDEQPFDLKKAIIYSEIINRPYQ
jgi:hypothetical protein